MCRPVHHDLCVCTAIRPSVRPHQPVALHHQPHSSVAAGGRWQLAGGSWQVASVVRRGLEAPRRAVLWCQSGVRSLSHTDVLLHYHREEPRIHVKDLSSRAGS